MVSVPSRKMIRKMSRKIFRKVSSIILIEASLVGPLLRFLDPYFRTAFVRMGQMQSHLNLVPPPPTIEGSFPHRYRVIRATVIKSYLSKREPSSRWSVLAVLMIFLFLVCLKKCILYYYSKVNETRTSFYSILGQSAIVNGDPSCLLLIV
jgi:hypothetical protein